MRVRRDPEGRIEEVEVARWASEPAATLWRIELQRVTPASLVASHFFYEVGEDGISFARSRRPDVSRIVFVERGFRFVPNGLPLVAPRLRWVLGELGYACGRPLFSSTPKLAAEPRLVLVDALPDDPEVAALIQESQRLGVDEAEEGTELCRVLRRAVERICATGAAEHPGEVQALEFVMKTWGGHDYRARLDPDPSLRFDRIEIVVDDVACLSARHTKVLWDIFWSKLERPGDPPGNGPFTVVFRPEREAWEEGRIRLGTGELLLDPDEVQLCRMLGEPLPPTWTGPKLAEWAEARLAEQGTGPLGEGP